MITGKQSKINLAAAIDSGKGTSNIPARKAESPVSRKLPMRYKEMSEQPPTSPSHWLFPAHRVFRFAGRGVSS
jgi:hypothetical protein